MSSESRQLLKMSLAFAFFFLPFVLLVARLLFGTINIQIIANPLLGGREEANGMGLVFTGLGAALFGREVFDATRKWRSMWGRRQPKQKT